MKNLMTYLLVAIVAISQMIACGNNDTKDSSNDGFNVEFVLPSIANITLGEDYVFEVTDGKAPTTSDELVLESNEGIFYIFPIVSSSATEFAARIEGECATGTYWTYIKRGDQKRPFGTLYIKVAKKLNFTPDEGSTIYGLVAVEDEGVKGVVVSDGVEVTTTNEDGIYQLKSNKKWGYVFISVPSGYEVPSEGVLPQFHAGLKAPASTIERVDFKLNKVSGQNTYKVFMLGDMHLANRTNDSEQFTNFTTDLTDYMGKHKGEKMYAITLGDMTWDLYWYSNSFSFSQYLSTINSQLKDIQIFHTMGNHDNDFKTTSDFDAAQQYVNYLTPTFYSFNLGKVHYVVLDDIDCSNYDGTESRLYTKSLSTEQLDWLAKDLAYVDKTTPLVVTMHAQVFSPTSPTEFKIDHDQTSTNSLFNLLDGYKVHFVTGHTHMAYNVTPQASIVGGRNFFEHNSGSICASWWWSGKLTPGVHIGTDGTPGGYAIWDVSDTELKWLYKSTGWPEDYQFRSYDLNNVHFSTADVPLMSSAVKNAYQVYADAYPENTNNEVLINIWNWNANWTLSVVEEGGQALTPTAVAAYDPLHIAALTVKRFNNASLTSAPSFITSQFIHFFKVKASSADADLTITVKDEFGHTWTENMQRPKAFSTDAYKAE